MKTIVCVDMQNDFVTGVLGCDEAREIVPTVVQILDDNKAAKLIFTQDTHYADYPDTLEGKLLPVLHCQDKSEGAALIPELEAYAKQAAVVQKPSFGSLALSQYVPADTDELIIMGLYSDICVISNALILRAAFPNLPITLYSDASAGTTLAKHQAALEVMQSCQIKVEPYLKFVSKD